MNVGTFKFGSKVMGTNMPWSDDDHGYVTVNDFSELYNFDKSKPTGRKAQQRKNEKGEDVLLVPLLQFFRNANKPSVNFHGMLATLESKYIDVLLLQNVVDVFFDRRSYYFSTVSFCDNCPMTLKGAVHRAYAAELALTQDQLGMFNVRPDFWVVDPDSVLPTLLQLLDSNGQEQGNVENTLGKLYWSQQDSKVNLLKNVAEKTPSSVNSHERYEQLARLLFDVQVKLQLQELLT